MELLLTSIIAFATTNIDDLFILTIFFSNAKFDSKAIVLGQYLGISTLIAISFTGSFIGLVIDATYVGLLGLFPVYIGIRSAIDLTRNKSEEDDLEKVKKIGNSNDLSKIVSVASVTIANGGDNIGIYVPLFAVLTISGKITMALIFLIMTALWCIAARYLSKRPFVQQVIEKYGHVITPFVFILLGIYIMYESKTFSLFMK